MKWFWSAFVLFAGAQLSFAQDTEVVVPRLQQSIVVTTPFFAPQAETYTADVSKRSLFLRDDQLLQMLNGGINAGQHEGGGKSVEVRRFGFNLDHGGVSGGLKVLVDGVQQNQGTQGHGQGYLGALKSLTPELIEEIHTLNGPFSAEYGDFSGLGVVHIRIKEKLPDVYTLRFQRGSFDSSRTFFSYSPSLEKADGFLAYEASRSDGPFLNPMGYRRDNVTGNYVRHLNAYESLGLKLNFGRNDFRSSGQIPLDLVASGELPRFGAIDSSNGGRQRLGTIGAYYRRSLSEGRTFKIDGFASRSLFDLYSNFTMFLNDAGRGDRIHQHDSRYEEGFNTQYVHPYTLLGAQSLLTAGTNLHDNQINVGSHARVRNAAGYAQQAMDFLRGKLHVEGGLRWDYFSFGLNDSTLGAARLQPKIGLGYRPSTSLPMTINFNYGRGINTQDARGIVERPSSPRIATTDFYQAGASFHAGRLSFSSDLFLIDRSNEQVYIPDDGTFELKGPSRSYGYEGRSTLRVSRYVTLDAGITQVTNSFYRATAPREYVDSAPHTVGNAALTLSGWKNLYSSLRYRHVGNYRLDPLDASIRASGFDVIDWSLTKPIRSWMDLNVAIDNLTGKRYYETQNYFESRVAPNAPAAERIHGTPGYPVGVTVGVTIHVGGS